MTSAPTTEGFVQSGRRRVPLQIIRERASRAAAGLLAESAEGGSVALLLRNDIPFIEATLAAGWSGRYAVPINWHFKSQEVRHVLEDSGASHLVVHADLLRRFRDAIPEWVSVRCVPTPDELCSTYDVPPGAGEPPDGVIRWDRWLRGFDRHSGHAAPLGSMFYTSGTTGLPKGVKRAPPDPDHAPAYARLRGEWFGYREGLRTAMIGPMYHSVQSSYALAAVRSNGGVVLLPRFDAESVLRTIEELRLTHLHLVPTMMSRLLRLPASTRRRYDLSSLEFVIHGAAPCPRDVKRRMIEWWGPIIYEYYGTTEAGMVTRSSSEEWLEREGTVGKAWPGRTVRVYDAEGNVLPAHTEGEIYMSLGLVPDFTYHRADERRAEIERDGLITSGDVGYLDEQGYLFLCDRKSDVVITGGVNVYPAEVEAALSGHPDVLDCAVFGIPDEEYGEAVAAAVQLVASRLLSAKEIRDFLAARIASYKVPRHVRICESLPRDDSGKIFRRRLRDEHWAASGRRI